jgi:hypothetical protein
VSACHDGATGKAVLGRIRVSSDLEVEPDEAAPSGVGPHRHSDFVDLARILASRMDASSRLRGLSVVGGAASCADSGVLARMIGFRPEGETCQLHSWRP